MSTFSTEKEIIGLKYKTVLNWDIMEPIFRFAIIIFAFIFIFIAIKEDVFFTWEFAHMGKNEHIFFRYILFFSGLIFISSLIIRTILWFRYNTYKANKITEWPDISVIIPAFNESEVIYHTIDSIVNCNYPKGKLRIISVDDGSTDDTFFYMHKAKEKFPKIVDIIRFHKNKGKRRGFYEAFQMIKTPFVLTVDSDTKLHPNAIKEILIPMIINKKVGAVTGRIKIWNSNANIFTKMLNAHFAMAFDFTRAIQSTFLNVLCLSGAFSAYRVSILQRVIDEWLKQKFLNKPCTYGEDRSLTNHILKIGYGTAYQREAISFTIVPEKFSKILKMLTRWARSNIRESIIFSKFMFNSRRKGNRILPFIEFFSIASLFVLHFFWFYYFLFSGFITGNLIFRILSYSILFGIFYSLYYMRIEKKKDFPYIIVFSIFSTFFTLWIFTVAGASLTKKGWSTR